MKRARSRVSARSRLRSTATAFARNDQGGATIWNVTWLLVFAGMAGLAIDSSNGYRNIAISQSTGDTASLGGAIELPNPLREEAKYTPGDSDAVIAATKAAALDYAQANMTPGIYGDVLDEDDIFIGHWNTTTREFKPITDADFGNLSMNAVRVYLFQSESDRGNGVPTTLMHMAGIPFWDVVTVSTSAQGPTDCHLQGFMSKRKVCQTANNHWFPGHCLYGDEGIRMTSNNTFEAGVVAGMPKPPAAVDGIPDIYKTENGGDLSVVYGSQTIPFIDSAGGQIHDVIQDIMAGDTYHMTPNFNPEYDPESPSYDPEKEPHPSPLTLSPQIRWLDATTITTNKDPSEPEDVSLGSDPGGGNGNGNDNGGGQGGGSSSGPKGCEGGKSGGSDIDPLEADYDPFEDVTVEANKPDENSKWTPDEGYDAGYLEPGHIYYTDKNITIDGDLRGVVLATTGDITVSNGSSIEDSVLISLNDADNGGHSVKLNQARLGNVDKCKLGGEVKIYTMGSISGNAKNEFYGVTLVAGGSVGTASQTNASWGLSVYAGGNIFSAAQMEAGAPGIDDIKTAGGCADGIVVNAPDESMRIAIVE